MNRGTGVVRVLAALALAGFVVCATPGLAAGTASWSYGDVVDQMAGKTTGKYAEIGASNTLNLRSPFGAVVPTMTVMNTSLGVRIKLYLPKGRFDDGRVSIKFDDGPVTDIWKIGYMDGSTDFRTLQFSEGSPGGKQLFGLFKKSKRVKFQVWLFDNGAQVVEFNIDGLNPAMLETAKKKK
jgi:hypothetical protein